MATWKKVVVEDSAGHIAQTALKADKLSFSANQGPEVLFQTNGGETSSLNKGTEYQVLRMNSGATEIEYTSDIVETRNVNQTISGEKLFSQDFGTTKASDATSSDLSVDSGRLRFKRSHWNGSAAVEDTLQMQMRQDSDDNTASLWEWVVGTPNSSNNNNTDMIFKVDKEGSATVNKFVTIVGGIIKNASGNANITLVSNSGVDIGGDLKVGGNDIKSSTGDIAISLRGNDVTVADQLTVTGNLIVNGTTTTINTSNISVEDKVIELANGATDAASASGSGINVNTTNSTQEPTLLWTNGATLTGWGLKPEGEAATYPIAVMTQSTSAGSGDSAGVGTFHYDTNGDDLYLRTA